MVSRFFGGGKAGKKSIPPPTSTEDTTEEDGFTVIGGESGHKAHKGQHHSHRDHHLKGLRHHHHDDKSHDRPNPAQAAQPGQGLSSTCSPKQNLNWQMSAGGSSHVLDGVPFVMHDRLRAGATATVRGQELQACLCSTQACLDVAQELLSRSRRHDFQLEKDVVESDITATMKRMHLAHSAY